MKDMISAFVQLFVFEASGLILHENNRNKPAISHTHTLDHLSLCVRVFARERARPYVTEGNRDGETEKRKSQREASVDGKNSRRDGELKICQMVRSQSTEMK